MTISARCLSCHGVVEHDPRRIIGCNCDPDAPFWVYITRDGEVKGWSLAQWEVITNDDGSSLAGSGGNGQ